MDTTYQSSQFPIVTSTSNLSKDGLDWLYNLLISRFKKDYVQNLFQRIIRNNDEYRICTLDDLIKKYPDFKDNLDQLTRSKFKNLDVKLEKQSSFNNSKTFWRIESGITLLVPLIEHLILGGLIASPTDVIVDKVTKMFTNSVYTKDDWFLSYIDSHNTLENILVKIPKDENLKTIEVAYLFLDITAEKQDSFLHSKSKTTIKSEVRSQQFSNAQGYFDWIHDVLV
ncbi:hypothetical protein [Nostoc sp. TCL26-01]|uniref:hypothetical protein n=1 Tax=Nostoc sp. TCL26-01 TaxID=2576904 RepID=UPI0015C0892C|nr:hypothetical protein [Nostoc sp. TCL26-01]QLE55375.1 hypothetical protein FD725_07515 [Nostoc sp. TCL26-01]